MSTTKTAIEWTDRTWSPVRGCSIVSPGCHHCYAMKQAHRFSGPGQPYEGLTRMTSRSGPQWTGQIRTVEAALLEPLRWRKPAKVFVNSMSDLFHEGVPDEFIDRVFAVMALAQRQTFQILTKRPKRLVAYLKPERTRKVNVAAHAYSMAKWGPAVASRLVEYQNYEAWPLPNVWLGVSVENRPALARLDDLRATPAAVRFLSLEPLLEDLGTLDLRGIQWVIVGGESGPGARPCRVEWVRAMVRQCKDAGVPVFVKQLGAVPTMDAASWDRAADAGRAPLLLIKNARRQAVDGGALILAQDDRKGGDPSEWPADLRVREFPGAA